MRGIVPLFLLFALCSQVRTSPAYRRDWPNNDARAHLERLEHFLEDRAEDRKELFKNKDSNQEIKGTIPAAGELFEGDMIMDNELRRAVLGGANKRSMVFSKKKIWPKGIVPYVFAPGIAEKSKICLKKAMASFKKHTCIKFVKRTTQTDYLYLKSQPNYCSSYVGRRGGRQPVHIGHGCTRLGTCEHELLHALGMIHEQSRVDRDAHISVKWDNIKEKEKHNFNKYSYATVKDEGVPYNYASVMHYPNHAFAIDRDYPTLVSKKDPELIFGQRTKFSVGDVQQVNSLYKCKADKHSGSLVSTLTDDKIEEDLLEVGDAEDYQPLVFPK